MVTFELVSGDRSTFRPDSSGRLVLRAKGMFVFPTKWLIYQIKCGNVGVDDHDLFVSEVSKSKLLLMDILVRMQDYAQYDFVVLSSEKGDYKAYGYNLPENREVYPMINEKQGLPCLGKLRFDIEGNQTGPNFNKSARSFNQDMEAYYASYGLFLKHYDLQHKVGAPSSIKLYDLKECVKDWLAADELRAIDARREAMLKKRHEKAERGENHIPSWVILPSEKGARRSTSFF